MIPISDYINNLSGQGVASPNRYWAEFSLPPGIDGTNFGALNSNSMNNTIGTVSTQWNSGADLSMKCVNMSMPSRALMTVENRHWGTPYKLPYAATYDEISFSFVASRDLRERQFFEVWQETIVNISMNSLNFYDEYVAPCKLYQLDHENKVTYSVILYECYPVNLGQIDYSYTTTNDTVAVPITLAYRRWRNLELH